jgi:hypothetical protein
VCEPVEVDESWVGLPAVGAVVAMLGVIGGGVGDGGFEPRFQCEHGGGVHGGADLVVFACDAYESDGGVATDLHLEWLVVG